MLRAEAGGGDSAERHSPAAMDVIRSKAPPGFVVRPAAICLSVHCPSHRAAAVAGVCVDVAG
jgi:hypothetical protein